MIRALYSASASPHNRLRECSAQFRSCAASVALNCFVRVKRSAHWLWPGKSLPTRAGFIPVIVTANSCT